MLIEQVERYISIRQSLGYKLRDHRRELRHYARLAEKNGNTHVTGVNATQWADRAPSPYARSVRMLRVIQLARFLKAEDPVHEVPSFEPYRHVYTRPLPYIYSPEEISRMLGATGKLQKYHPLRRKMYFTLIGLIASTGMRVSEALDLRFDDVSAEGVLRIRSTKFGKSRYIPLHPTAVIALNRYLELRRKITTTDDDHVFISTHGKRIAASTVNHTFRQVLKLARIARTVRGHLPRIHDLRHTFATRALEACPSDRKSVAKHFVALCTYLGHVDIKAGYWYLETTPTLMSAMASAAELLAQVGAL